MKSFDNVYLILIFSIFSGCSSPETAVVSPRDITEAVFANGYIITEDEYLLTANTQGYITNLLVKEGDSVKHGDELLFLSNDVQSAQLSNAQTIYMDALNKLDNNSPQISQLKLQIEQAKIQLDTDKKNYERFQRLTSSHAVSQYDFEQAELKYESAKRNVEILEQSLTDLINSLELNVSNAKTQLDIQRETNADYFLSSSVDGKILAVYKHQGELVNRGETIARVGGGKPIIKLYVAEEDINRIRLKQKTIISLNTNPNQLFEAFISKIYPSFDEKEQSFIVEAVFTTSPNPLFANTQLQANIIIDTKENALTIPAQFLLTGDSVFLENKSKKAVKIGIRTPEWIEIVEGLEAKQKIVWLKKEEKR